MEQRCQKTDELTVTPLVSRVELIDETGRVYVNWDAKDVSVSLQDEGRTLKVFLANNNGTG